MSDRPRLAAGPYLGTVLCSRSQLGSVVSAMLLLSALTLRSAAVEAKRPDPARAALLSAGSTLVPLGVTAALWLTGDGPEDPVRFHLGLTFLALGSILGPAIGLFYAEAPGDAMVTLLIRLVAGGVMLGGVAILAREETRAENTESGAALALVGGIPTLSLDIYDVIRAASAAEETRYPAEPIKTAKIPR